MPEGVKWRCTTQRAKPKHLMRRVGFRPIPLNLAGEFHSILVSAVTGLKMKKIDIGQAVTILANFGVIAGIVFLAFELQQNTQAVRLASAQSYLTGGSSLDLQIATDSEFAGLLIRGDDTEPLGPTEELRLDRWNYAVFRQWETAHYLHKIGALEDELWVAYRQEVRKVLLRSAGMRRYWSDGRYSFTPDFQSFIETIVESSSAR